MSLTNEYEKLLNIIDEDKKNSKKDPIVKKDSNKSEAEPKSKIDDYKKLNINNDYVTKSSNNFNNSKNTEFDLNIFKSNLRKKLISDYYKIREYERPYISITDILSCIRKVYYERMKYNPEEGKLFTFPQLKLINEVGNTIHDNIQNNYEFDEKEKVLKSEKYKLKGRVDAIKNKTVFEIKSVEPKEFPLKEIRQRDYDQGIIYGHILKYDYGYDVNQIEVIYVSRNLKDIQILKTKIDFKRAEKIMEKSIELYECLKISKSPHLYDKPEDECKFCQFNKYCKVEKNINLSEDEDSKSKNINLFELGD